MAAGCCAGLTSRRTTPPISAAAPAPPSRYAGRLVAFESCAFCAMSSPVAVFPLATSLASDLPLSTKYPDPAPSSAAARDQSPAELARRPGRLPRLVHFDRGAVARLRHPA